MRQEMQVQKQVLRDDNQAGQRQRPELWLKWLGGIAGAGGVAGLSTALRFGRDDNVGVVRSG
jgi:hypothetical protein